VQREILETTKQLRRHLETFYVEHNRGALKAREIGLKY
jgi:hypothetical protein